MAIKYDPVEAQVAALIIDGEYKTARENHSQFVDDFGAAIDLFEMVRTEKEYDWMSDIFIPEFPSHVLTQASMDAAQYFQTREFVGVYLEDGSDEAKRKSDAAKELVNRTLNRKHLYYYQKFMRARLNNNLGGFVYARCWWEQETKSIIYARTKHEVVGYGYAGEPIVESTPEEFEDEVIAEDHFNFDIVDSRNVFTDNTYTYSLQQKDWVILRSERSRHELIQARDAMGYKNLDQLESIAPAVETDTSKESYNKGDEHQKVEKIPINKPLDILERHGKFWCKVLDRDEDNYPVKIEPGIDKDGNVLEDAEYIETIITHASTGNHRVLIRFQPAPYVDAHGNPYRPILRGLCYIHPTKDMGFSDAKLARELQIAINDTFNIGNDRVQLATLPTLLVKKFAVEDNSDIYIKPNHMIELEDPQTDLKELGIQDNIQGSMQQLALLMGKMQQVTAKFPTTMGDIPADSSTTATAVAGADARGTMRSNYQSLTFEHTFLVEFYWMILQMSYQFAKPETAEKLLGDKVMDFDPSADYVYKPLSQSIESEYSKGSKIKQYVQLLGYVSQIQNPKIFALMNHMLARVFTLMGDEFETFGKALLDENAPVPETGAAQPGGQGGIPASNQAGVPMSLAEQSARGAMGG